MMDEDRVVGRRSRVTTMVAIAVAAAVAWSTLGTFSTAAGQSPSPAATVSRAHKGARQPSFDKPLFFLILGGDARTGNPERARVDSIHIVGIDPVKKKASILGIPRDSFVEIPGRGRNKINAATTFGGPDLMVRTVENVSGCKFDYYMMTSFEGFRGPRGAYKTKGIINELGGIHLNVKENLTERLPYRVKRGRNLLNGGEALSYARNRHERPRGDFDRSVAQGEIMVATLAEMRSDFKDNPGTALRNLSVLRRWVRMNIALSESLALGLVGMQIKPGDVKNEVVDGSIGSDSRAGSIVRITSDGIRQLQDICTDGLLDQ